MTDAVTGRLTPPEALAAALEQSQWLPPARILEAQFTQLAHLLSRLVRTVPAITDAPAPYLAFMASPSAANFRQLPVIRRAQVSADPSRHANADLLSVPGRKMARETSGSTGQPLPVVSTEATRLYFDALKARAAQWHPRPAGRPFAEIRYSVTGEARAPDGAVLPDAFRRARGEPDAVIHYLDVLAPVEAQMRWLQRVAPGVLMTYPSNLQSLLRHTLATGEKPVGLDVIHTISETLLPGLRDGAAGLWGARIVDTYSCIELGWLALQCPQCDLYHVQSENVIVEVLRDDGSACAPGEQGRVVLTGLHNAATPFIRYEIGDYAIPGPPCACGRGLPTLQRILGRQRNRLALPDGRRVFPDFGDFREFIAIIGQLPRRWQIIQHTLDELELCAVMSPATPEQEDAVRALIRRHAGDHLQVRFTYPDDLAAGANGKFEEFVSRVPDAAGG